MSDLVSLCLEIIHSLYERAKLVKANKTQIQVIAEDAQECQALLMSE